MTKDMTFDLMPDNNLFTMTELENPSELIERALDDVTNAFDALYENYNMSYDEFYTYIKFHNDTLSREIDELWENIDCDIYDHYDQGTLLSFELANWKTELIEWKEKVVAAIRDIVKVEFYDDFRTDAAHAAYVEAA